MLANGHETEYNTVQSHGASVNSAGQFRHSHPGAGASSHYFNYSFYACRDIPSGAEILVDYGQNWFKERKDKQIINEIDSNKIFEHKTARSIEWLKKNGICLDNLKVGPSTNQSAGRGAFATRSIRQGDIVAPVPVVQIPDRRALDLFKIKTDGKHINDSESIEQSLQLLLNYCFGHRNSSVLLFPIVSICDFSFVCYSIAFLIF